MTYAHRDQIYDADTHMMERPDWIAEFSDSSIRPYLEPFVGGKKEILKQIDSAIKSFNERKSNKEIASKASKDFMSMKYKGWNGLGAFNASERKLANDLLGFEAYILFPTSAFNQVIAAKEEKVLLGGVQALNRGLATFREEDKRMFPTAYVPLGAGPDIAKKFVNEAISMNFSVILIDTVAPTGQISFTHPDYDKFWAAVQEADLAITLHVAMIFDGVLERFPKLRIGVVELGASWIISWMKHLDQSYRAFRKFQDLSQLKLLPSEYVLRQIKVTPFAGEDIGWILNTGGEDLLMFASDYPHHEGTDDPIGRFERTMEGVKENQRSKFYTKNFKSLLGSHI